MSTETPYTGGPLDLVSFEARVYRVGNDSERRGDADHILPGDAIAEETEFSDRLQEWAGTASLSWISEDGEHAQAITTGDRVELVYEVAAPGSASLASGATYGEATFGDAGYTDPEYEDVIEYRWTGKAKTPTFEFVYTGPDVEIVEYEVELDEYVFGILSDRVIYGAFEGDISDIVTDVIQKKAPEIETDGIEPVGKETDREYDGRDAKEIIVELAEIGDAVLTSSNRTLGFRPLDTVATETQFTLDDADFGELVCSGDSTSLATSVRVDGGTDISLDEMTADDVSDIYGYQRVTENDRLTYQLDPEKSRLDRVDVWIRDTGSDEGVRVRIQSSNAAGDGPRSIDNPTVDIVSDSTGVAIPLDGWRERFRLQREALPPDPWLIIESTGLNGQDIGVDADGNPAVRTYYPYDIAVEVNSPNAVGDYGLVERVYPDDSIVSFQSARDIAEANLQHNQHPNREVSFEAARLRAHDLQCGEVVEIDKPQYGMTGPHIVMDRKQRVRGINVWTDLVVQSVESL